MKPIVIEVSFDTAHGNGKRYSYFSTITPIIGDFAVVPVRDKGEYQLTKVVSLNGDKDKANKYVYTYVEAPED